MPYDNKLKEIIKPDTDGVKAIYSGEDISHSPENLPCTDVHHQAENVASGYEYTVDIFVDTDDVSTDIFSDEMNNSATSGETISPLKEFITAEFTKKRPQFTEYKTRGYNAPLMDLDVINALKARLQKERALESYSVRSRLIEQAEILTNAVQRMPCDAMKEKQHYHASRLVEATMRALEALETVDTVNPCDWKTLTEEVVGRQLDTLTGDAVTRITKAGTLPFSNNHASTLQQQLKGLLFSPSCALVAENIKFATLRNSWLADDRVARNKLTSSLNIAVEQILSEAREAKKYALQHLPAGGKPTVLNFLRALPPLADALEEVVMTLRAQVTLIAPTEGEPGKADGEPKVDWMLSPVAAAQDMAKNAAKSTFKQGRTAAANLTFMASQSVNSIKESAASIHRALKLPSPGCSDSERRAVRDTGLLLLDELHQVKRRIMLLPSYARSVQEAVEQHQQIAKPIVAFSHNNILDGLLDEQLKNEGVRWSKMIQRSQEELAALMAPVARLAVKEHEDSFKSELKATLFGFAQIGEAGPGQKATELFWEMTKTIVHGMAQIAREVDGSTERLAGHGHAGGIELKTNVARWLQQLEVLDGEVRATIATATGAPLDYFSRGGMLARGVAEWAEGLKQAYLETVTPEHRDAQAALFMQTLTEVIRENRDDFSKKSDPDADRFLQRLALELRHAAQNTTVWPPSPEEVLAGVRTLPDDIRLWAEKKVVRGALSTLVWQGVKLVSSPVSIPAQLAIRGARMGLSVNRYARAMKKSVRMGQGTPNTAINQLVKRELSRAAFRVTVSLSPAGGWALAALITAERLYGKKGSDGLLARTLTTLPEDVLWLGGSAGVSQALNTHIARTVEQAVAREEMQEWEKTPAWEADVARLSLASELQTETESLSDNSEQNGQQRSSRNKRSVSVQEPPSSNVDEAERQKHQETVDKIKQSGHLDFEHNFNYSNLSVKQKTNTYKYAIKYVLNEIERDGTLSKSIKDNARLAQLGASLLVPVNVAGYKITNTFLLPDQPGSKTGVLLCLDHKKPYTLVRNGSDLPDHFKWDMPRTVTLFTKRFRGRTAATVSGVDLLSRIQNGNLRFNDFFNYNNPEAIGIADLALELTHTMENSYSYRNGYRKNKTLIHRGILGAYIPDDGTSVRPVTHKLEISWENLTPGEYLRSFAQPFATLSGQMQLIVSSSNKDSIQTTERKVAQAEYVGAWVDVTAGAITSFSSAGIILGMLQSAASIAADIKEGKACDPLNVAGLILGCIPGGTIATRISKLSDIAGNAVKYGLMIGNNFIDLAIVGKNIKSAVESEEPLEIYQAFLSSGMSVQNSYDIAKNMSSKLKMSKTMNESASLDALKAVYNNDPDYSLSSTMIERTFKFGRAYMLGRINNGEIEISKNNGANWRKGSKTHLLAYRLQNAGGKRGFRPADQPQAGSSSSGPEEQVRRFTYYGKTIIGRIRNRNFEISDDGDTWKRGSILQRYRWEKAPAEELSVKDLDKRINKASGEEGAGNYSNICYGTAIRNAEQAGVITPNQTKWLLDTIAKKDIKGEVIGSDHYRRAFNLQNKKPLSSFSSAGITEPGFLHIGKRLKDGTVVYEHVAYVHVTDQGVYIYQVNGAYFLLALNGPEPMQTYNNIGVYVSKSHYKHLMDETIITRFNDYFAKVDQDGSQAVFTFTPAGEVQENYRIMHPGSVVSETDSPSSSNSGAKSMTQ
ncbi:TPA: hypothetical protein ACGB3K_004702 [Klebsiella aerogenes]|uniref:hypothetical protein n=1 Tax=Klebsiella aerogenes TaxID=548 RepID=UPI0028DECB02|nr:hypothetical protein [Klebsiella aerogenes]MDT8885903.1 hypothetical protein [Klebsiella aerogenes]HBV9945486.1 hypothetical protein [Klebsiella aerogenes]